MNWRVIRRVMRRSIGGPGASPVRAGLAAWIGLGGGRALAQSTANLAVKSQTIFAPHSGPAHLIEQLSYFVLEITGAIFVVVGGLLVFVLVRFRRRKTDDAAEPPQIYGSTQIELAWTIVPALIVVTLFLTAARIIFAIESAPVPPGSLHVDVVGHQFWWEFRYPGYGLVTANELHIPVSGPQVERVSDLRILSADVDHSFWAPELFGKIDTVPNQTNRLTFNPDSVGIYYGQCAQFCGTAHAQMLLRVYVQTPEDFAAWVANQQRPAVDDPAAARGRQIFESQACVSCHTIRGTGAHGRYGPDLTHLMSRDTLASGIIPNTPTNLKRWIHDPQSIKPGAKMPAMNLGDSDTSQIVAYLSTLK